MNRDAAPDGPFGRTRAQAARGAVLLALLGAAVVAGFLTLLTRPHTPLGAAVGRSGLAPYALLLGIGLVAALALAGYWKSLRTSDRFRITRDGLEVESPLLGRYLLEWSNLAEARATETGSLGIRLRDREALLRTHRGAERQRELLATMEPYGEWDLLYPRADLGHPPEQVETWLRPYLERAG